MDANEKALQALRLFYEVGDLGDFIYNIRDREAKGWDGPLVQKWSDACRLAREALNEARLPC